MRVFHLLCRKQREISQPLHNCGEALQHTGCSSECTGMTALFSEFFFAHITNMDTHDLILGRDMNCTLLPIMDRSTSEPTSKSNAATQLQLYSTNGIAGVPLPKPYSQQLFLFSSGSWDLVLHIFFFNR